MKTIPFRRTLWRERPNRRARNVFIEKVLRLAPFFSFPLVSPNRPHPGRRATRELRGVKNNFTSFEKLTTHLGARRRGAVRSEQGRRINGVRRYVLSSQCSLTMSLFSCSLQLLSFSPSLSKPCLSHSFTQHKNVQSLSLDTGQNSELTQLRNCLFAL